MLFLEIQLRRDLNPDTELSTIFFLIFPSKITQTSSFFFDTSISITLCIINLIWLNLSQKFEIREIFKHPIIFKSIENGVQKFSCGGNNGFSGTTRSFYFFIKILKILAMSLCYQHTLNQRSSSQFRACLADMSIAIAFLLWKAGLLWYDKSL